MGFKRPRQEPCVVRARGGGGWKAGLNAPPVTPFNAAEQDNRAKRKIKKDLESFFILPNYGSEENAV